MIERKVKTHPCNQKSQQTWCVWVHGRCCIDYNKRNEPEVLRFCHQLHNDDEAGRNDKDNGNSNANDNLHVDGVVMNTLPPLSIDNFGPGLVEELIL